MGKDYQVLYLEYKKGERKPVSVFSSMNYAENFNKRQFLSQGQIETVSKKELLKIIKEEF